MAVKEKWRSGMGFALAAAGSAVGLGNLWGFAYRASQGGGAAFLLLYIIIVCLVCLPVLVAEMVLGRSTGKSPLLAPVSFANERWKPMGFLFVVASCGILSFYAVLMGWTAHTLIHSIFFGLPVDMPSAEKFFQGLSTGKSVLLGQVLSLFLTGSVVAAGIKGGIERLTRWCMPLLFFLLAVLALWAATLPGAMEGYKTFLLRWDIQELLNPTTVRNAFTQAFFSIGTGIGCILAYSAYLDSQNKIPREAIAVVGMDTSVGLLAGMITFPVVMSFGLKDVVTSSTVGTLFISLPTGLSSLGVTGQIVAILFFFLAYIAALTSSISLLEVPVASLIDKLGWKRSKSVWVSSFLIFITGLPAALDLKTLGRMDAIFGGILLVFGGLLLTILLGWIFPRKFDLDLSNCNTSKPIRTSLKFMLRWISPPVICFGLIVSIYDLIYSW
ncbi:sodium-dependent transporter [Prochlorococcus sp. MIT 1341]|uniref:sodium-dependent transporter n=1 Tax=Prochlorococcus sp. MIT 1341 TaxID=3096221 RepID=UPI002A7569AF|nr:sodium-dependent transporter [Prochlorococcus sp. MIT 1341]